MILEGAGLAESNLADGIISGLHAGEGLHHPLPGPSGTFYLPIRVARGAV